MIDDARLDDILASIGPLLVLEPEPVEVPPVVAHAGRPARRIPRGRRRRWLLAGAALAGVVGASVSPLRGAVADWLGIGSTHVRVEPNPDVVPAALPGIDDRATPISRRQAETMLGSPLFRRLDVTDLGPPTGFATIVEGGVIVVWPDHTTLWVHSRDMDVAGWLDKLVAAEQQVQPVDDLGDEALAIVGDHVLQTPSRTLRAGTTVLWTRDDVELRLAGDHPIETLAAIARELDRA